ncbi:MAG: GH36-type glycosyl hydrolase domain-containing protein [Elusimicrobiota bacterium]
MKTNKNVYRYIGSDSSFIVENPIQLPPIYFPLCNEDGILSAVGPQLQGDIKIDQHTFLTIPVSIEDLHLSRSSRNFWLVFDDKTKTPWSVTGMSSWQKASPSDKEKSIVEAGHLWHQLTRVAPSLGLTAQVLSFIPPEGTHEIFRVEIKNISRKSIRFTATSAIPLYGRSADNLRDHRHVTSLLNRLEKEKFGISLKPTMSFNERGHLVNSTQYYVVGIDGAGNAPVGFFPTLERFIEEGGDLDTPGALKNRRSPVNKISVLDQGKEAIAALQFKPISLKPGQSTSFTLLLGIDREGSAHEKPLLKLKGAGLASELNRTKKYWENKLSSIVFKSGDLDFNQWIKWVQMQPHFRKLFGCSFLPDFDYGRGGRGWRDLWQDCLALLLANPEEVRPDILNNYGGVRLDGSNATIIARKKEKVGDQYKWIPEFIADRNSIARTWMDHGIWPLLTTALYLNQTGDWDLLFEQVPYFRDALTHRAKKVNSTWAKEEELVSAEKKCKSRSQNSSVYTGTVLEHVLVQTLVQFFNVGEHNMIRLEDADWNDGLDLAHARGESVTFTGLYASNLELIASLLEMIQKKTNLETIELAEELDDLLDSVNVKVDYDNIFDKQARLKKYFEVVSGNVSGTKKKWGINKIIQDLRAKAQWIKSKINTSEWIECKGSGWFNGYYDNTGSRVEGLRENGEARMTLTGQVFPIMSGTASKERVFQITKAVDQYLFDKKIGGYRLNTNFKALQPHLGRAFSFSYGEKENGAVFSHMVVMYSNALYQRGFFKEGFRALNSLHEMAKDSAKSQIYPGLPEYFNNEGRGRYAYLTGSASWYVLTLLTQAFGVRGWGGDLLLHPQLVPQQFDRKNEATVIIRFAGSEVSVTYRNLQKSTPDKWKIKNIISAGCEVQFTLLASGQALITREFIQKSPKLSLTVNLVSE